MPPAPASFVDVTGVFMLGPCWLRWQPYNEEVGAIHSKSELPRRTMVMNHHGMLDSFPGEAPDHRHYKVNSLHRLHYRAFLPISRWASSPVLPCGARKPALLCREYREPQCSPPFKRSRESYLGWWSEVSKRGQLFIVQWSFFVGRHRWQGLRLVLPL